MSIIAIYRGLALILFHFDVEVNTTTSQAKRRRTKKTKICVSKLRRCRTKLMFDVILKHKFLFFFVRRRFACDVVVFTSTSKRNTPNNDQFYVLYFLE